MESNALRWVNSDGKVSVYIVNASLFKTNDLFVPWRLNRPSDISRVRDIRNYLLEHKPDKIDGEILAAEIETEWIKGNRKYEVYDGNHRREAIQTGFCDIHPKAKVVLTIIKVKNDEELLEEFRRINKNVPLSDADLCGDIIIQKKIHDIAKEYCDLYPSLVRITARPQRPNFNRDAFAQELFMLYKEFKETDRILDLLLKYNKYLGDIFACLDDTKNLRIMNKTIDGLSVSTKMYNTAKAGGCFLFLSKSLSDNIITYANKHI